MSVYTEAEQRYGNFESRVRFLGAPFTAQEVAESVDQIGGLQLAPDVLAVTGTAGAVIAARTGERPVSRTYKIWFGDAEHARLTAEKDAELSAAVSEVTVNFPRVYGVTETPLTILKEVAGRPVTIEGTFSVTEREFINGDRLADKLGDGGLGLPETVRVLGPVAEALDAMHTVGIVHRDVTPANIIVQPGSRGKIIDLDRAFRGTAQTDPNMVGTPGYVANEEFVSGARVSHKVDIWQLAATVYKSATGNRLIPGSNVIATMDIMTDNVAYAAHMQKQLSVLTPRVEGVMRSALHPNPEKRTDSAATFIRDLDRAHLRDTRGERIRGKLKSAATIFTRSRGSS